MTFDNKSSFFLDSMFCIVVYLGIPTRSFTNISVHMRLHIFLLTKMHSVKGMYVKLEYANMLVNCCHDVIRQLDSCSRAWLVS